MVAGEARGSGERARRRTPPTSDVRIQTWPTRHDLLAAVRPGDPERLRGAMRDMANGDFMPISCSPIDT